MPENSLDFNTLPPYQPRQFVPDNADFSQQEIVTALYEQLADRSVQSHDEMQHWLLDRSELEAAIDQHQAILYIRMTCQTDDAARAEAYKDFIETIVPAIKPCSDRLDRKFILDAKEIKWDPDVMKYTSRATDHIIK